MLIEITYNVTDVFMSTTETPVYVEISFEQPGSASAVWGSITGTLSNQTDLQTALDGKFDDPTGTSLQYIDGTGALQTFPLTLPVLQEVRNQTGATLDAGTVVYINGATGNKPTVTKAIATGDATSAQTLGMVSAAIANNGTGYVVVIGTCSGLDTSAYTEGQQLYLSYTTAGAVTTTKPYAPYHLVYIGIVTRAHPTLGTVEVRVQNGYELDEIHDVDALNPNNNDGIFYNSTTSLWEHKQISTALGYTPANAATTLTINGVTYDLSTSRSWTIPAGISGSGASGQVAYWTGVSSQSGSNNLFWDAANGRLGIGTNAPSSPFHVVGNGFINGNLAIGTTLNPWDNVQKVIQVGHGAFYGLANGNATVIANNAYFNSSWTYATTNAVGLYQIIGGQHGWYQAGSGTSGTVVSTLVQSMTLFATRNFAIGSTTDTGERLQVTGNVYISSGLQIGGNSAGQGLRIGRAPSNADATTALVNIAIPTTSTTAYRGFATSIGLFTSGFTLPNLAHFEAIQDGSFTAGVVTNHYGFRVNNFTSGTNIYCFHSNVGAATGRWNIYMAGTANNYMAGNLAIGSTSSITDWLNIAASTTAKAHIFLAAGVAPTSPNDGDIWFDGTDIKMRIGGVTKTFTLI